jgi:S1-C subfamily serine protease
LSYPNATYILGGNVSLSQLSKQVQQSVVVIRDIIISYNFFTQVYTQQQGSGFITTIDNKQVIVTNNHVVQGATNITVTFADGNSYSAKEIGSDILADLAVITVDPMPSGLQSLTLISSSTLQVGDPVVAVGSPYGLSGTLTTGVISALERTITETSSTSQSGPTVPDIIQTSTAINPGNSGGPLINYEGDVVGVTTAGISNSQELGFAIPSDTIMRELSSLVTTGSYDKHASIDAQGTDMNYAIAQAMGINTTYGFLVETISTQNGLKGGTTQVMAGGSQVIIGGDVVIAISGTRITNTDLLLSYLERNTLPGQTVNFTVIRHGQTQTVPVTIGKPSQ